MIKKANWTATSNFDDEKKISFVMKILFNQIRFILFEWNFFHRRFLFIMEEHHRVTWSITNKTNFIRFICYWFLSTSTCLFLLDITRIRLFFCSSKWRHFNFNGSFIESMVFFSSINDQTRRVHHGFLNQDHIWTWPKFMFNLRSKVIDEKLVYFIELMFDDEIGPLDSFFSTTNEVNFRWKDNMDPLIF